MTKDLSLGDNYFKGDLHLEGKIPLSSDSKIIIYLEDPVGNSAEFSLPAYIYDTTPPVVVDRIIIGCDKKDDCINISTTSGETKYKLGEGQNKLLTTFDEKVRNIVDFVEIQPFQGRMYERTQWGLVGDTSSRYDFDIRNADDSGVAFIRWDI